MKRMFCMIIAMILVFSMAIPAFAASITTDWSSTSGGSLGKCKVCGTLNYENSSSAGERIMLRQRPSPRLTVSLEHGQLFGTLTQAGIRLDINKASRTT